MRFWRETGDRLFLWFALAFWMFASNWAAVSLVNPADEARHLFYLLRLAGFTLILVGIYEKNAVPTSGAGRRRRGSSRP